MMMMPSGPQPALRLLKRDRWMKTAEGAIDLLYVREG
jgi:hypothetical protein